MTEVDVAGCGVGDGIAFGDGSSGETDEFGGEGFIFHEFDEGSYSCGIWRML